MTAGASFYKWELFKRTIPMYRYSVLNFGVHIEYRYKLQYQKNCNNRTKFTAFAPHSDILKFTWKIVLRGRANDAKIKFRGESALKHFFKCRNIKSLIISRVPIPKFYARSSSALCSISAQLSQVFQFSSAGVLKNWYPRRKFSEHFKRGDALKS
jgi:hypothetical protein